MPAGVDALDPYRRADVNPVDIVEELRIFTVERARRGHLPGYTRGETADGVADRVTLFEQDDSSGFVDFAGAGCGRGTAERATNHDYRSRWHAASYVGTPTPPAIGILPPTCGTHRPKALALRRHRRDQPWRHGRRVPGARRQPVARG